jgi:hypothetical protein
MLRARSERRPSSANPMQVVPLRSSVAQGRTQAATMLRDLAYVLHLTRTVRESLMAPVAS